MGLFMLSSVVAQQIDHTFTYQGELLENSAPVTGLYNFKIEGFDAAGGSKTNVSEHQLILVNDGLFTIPNIDLGVVGLDAYATFLQISVKPGIGVGVYTDLSPRQELKAVPYAHKVLDGTATNGQVYTFSTTGGWGPADPALSPWTSGSNGITYVPGTFKGVGIGTNNPFTLLDVVHSGSTVAKFEGPTTARIDIWENGFPRGYIGSVFDNSGANSQDFEIGTSQSAANMHIVTRFMPRITATAEGKIGINTITPNADLNIAGTNDGDLLRIQQNTLTSFGSTAFYVDDNGGASVGSWNTPPSLGLRIQGDTKQSITSNGMMKYMIQANCAATSSISKQYNGVNSGVATITAGGIDGLCAITFPFDIGNRFYQVSSIEDLIATNATCQISASGTALNCARHRSSTGALLPGQIMILVY